MKLVFLGTADFAVPALCACAEHHDVVVVITQPDRSGHRGRPAPRPVAVAAREQGLDVWQPAKIREAETEKRILGLAADALIVAAYGQIIPAALLDGPRHGGVNVHASLLPRWRGAAPVAAAILAGDAETGVSIMQMDAGLDTGAVHLQRRIPIPVDATTPSLTAILAELATTPLLEVLRALRAGGVAPTPQSEAEATYAPRLKRSDAETDWAAHTGVDIDRRVRALQPWPGVVALLAGERVQLLAGAPAEVAAVEPGKIARVEGESVVVAAREGGYRIDSLRPPGGRAMSPAAYLRGRRATGVPR
jgi:methionyl-tRNA formyltransferase